MAVQFLAAFIASPADDAIGGGLLAWFKKKKPALPVSPQYYPGENKATPNPVTMMRIPETITDGIDESQGAYQIHYTMRQQPDVGGALNFSWDLYGLPLNDVCGPWMVARAIPKPLGSFPTAFFQEAPGTSIGGLIPGQFIHQPLLDPNAPGSGYDAAGAW